jgi:hypothetical protein
MVKTTSGLRSPLTCVPARWAPAPSGVGSNGPVLCGIMRALGWAPYGWQEHVADLALEHSGEGGYRFGTVGVCVGRQNGKTSLVAARIVLEMLRGGHAVFTAQDRIFARERWQEYAELLVERLPAGKVKTFSRSNGQEHLTLTTGGRFGISTPTGRSPRGRSNDLVVIDEALTHESMKAIAALQPTMATRPDAQVWLLGNAGDLRAVMFRHYRDLGRQSSGLTGVTPGRMAWFEWAPTDDECEVLDRHAWEEAIPTLDLPGGVTAQSVADAAETMDPIHFRREYLNQWDDDRQLDLPDDRINLEQWAQCQAGAAAPGGRVSFGVDVPPERTSAVIVSASEVPPAVELVEERPGVEWAVTRCADLVGRHGGVVVYDPASQAATVGAALTARGVATVAVTARERAQAAALFDDAVSGATVAVRPSRRLDSAVEAARKGRQGDTFRWVRADPDADISPLVAASLAWWAAPRVPEGPPRPQVF